MLIFGESFSKSEKKCDLRVGSACRIGIDTQACSIGRHEMDLKWNNMDSNGSVLFQGSKLEYNYLCYCRTVNVHKPNGSDSPYPKQIVLLVWLRANEM